MSLKKFKPPHSNNGQTPDEYESVGVKSEEVLPKLGPVSLNEPEPAVDLGDFSIVWQYLESHPSPGKRLPNTEHVEMPASRKQFLQKAAERKSSVKADVSVGKRSTKTKKPTMPKSLTKKGQKSERQIAEPRKSKTKPTFAYSSPDEEINEASWDLPSYEDKMCRFASRRKSFLYVPPSFSSASISPTKPAPIIPATPSAADRRRNLIQKLISNYPTEVNQILPQPNLPSPSSLSIFQPEELHIFIDNSNILIGFYDTYKAKHKITDSFSRHPKFDFHAFATILERGRPVSRRYLVGSNPLIQTVPLARHLGYKAFILELIIDVNAADSERATSISYVSDSATRTSRRERKKEQAVDEILHLKILECLLDVEKPATIVLATGDAAPAEFSPDGGFLKCIQRALTRGWYVELVCWRKSMSRLWRDKAFRAEWRDTFSVIELDDYLDELVLEP